MASSISFPGLTAGALEAVPTPLTPNAGILRAWKESVGEDKRTQAHECAEQTVYVTHMLKVSYISGDLLCGMGVCKIETSVL